MLGGCPYPDRKHGAFSEVARVLQGLEQGLGVREYAAADYDVVISGNSHHQKTSAA